MKRVILSLIVVFVSCLSFSQTFDPAMRKVNIAMYAIKSMYVDPVNENKMAEDAIVGLLDKLDPHSTYLSPDEVKDMNENLGGEFDGIGIQFNMLTDTLYVVQVIAGGPSEKVGMRAGDRILQVNDTVIAGVKKKNTDIMKMLRGKSGTVVSVKVLRKGNPGLLEFRIVRGKIPVYSLDASYMVDKETGYIRLNKFAATTHDEFVKALKDLKLKGMKNLILDLQGNGGGYLNAAIALVDEFLSDGETIVYTKGTNQRRDDAKATGSGLFETGRLALIVDETTASASEIVSGAVQDWDRGVVVGRRTFGKGLVQRPIPLPDGSMIRLTTARYYTPTGRCIQKPYVKGDLEQYNEDLINRYNRGEMLSADSIHFPDSLKYKTLKNFRTVYGGGGIMPDYFVPLDTTRMTDFHRTVVAKGLINKVAMNIVDRDRNTLKKEYPSFNLYVNNYEISSQDMQSLVDFYLKDKTESSGKSKKGNGPQTFTVLTEKEQKDYDKALPLMKLQIKALIAEDVWGNTEYFKVINKENDSLSRAVKIIEDPAEYNRLLQPRKN